MHPLCRRPTRPQLLSIIPPTAPSLGELARLVSPSVQPGLVTVRGSHPHTTISQPSVYRRRRHAQSLRDPSQRPPGLVQLDRLVDLSEGQPLPPRLDTMTLKDGAHGPPIDAELPSGSGHASLWSGVRPSGRTRELPNQRLQLAKQRLCVVVTSRFPSLGCLLKEYWQGLTFRLAARLFSAFCRGSARVRVGVGSAIAVSQDTQLWTDQIRPGLMIEGSVLIEQNPAVGAPATA